LQILAENYHVRPLADVIVDAENGVFKPDNVALTFDDGYLDNLTIAVPLLEKYQIPATIFVTSGMLDSEYEFWWDELDRIFFESDDLPDTLNIEFTEGLKSWRTGSVTEWLQAYEEMSASLRSAKPEAIRAVMDFLRNWAGIAVGIRDNYRRLNISQLRTLAKSPCIEIGAHTVQHARLAALSRQEQLAELVESKKKIEEVIQTRVRFVSYPFGSAVDFNAETCDLVAVAGYEAGIANIQGQLKQPFDKTAVPRRLVRNWNRDLFADWLLSSDKYALEAQTISQRNDKLKAWLLQKVEVQAADD